MVRHRKYIVHVLEVANIKITLKEGRKEVIVILFLRSIAPIRYLQWIIISILLKVESRNVRLNVCMNKTTVETEGVQVAIGL